MSIQDCFANAQTDEDDYSWTHLVERDDARSALIRQLADRIVRARCARHHYDSWVEARDYGTKIFGKTRNGFAAAVIEAVGLPTEGIADDHIQGFVAEVLWRCLSEDHPHRFPPEWIDSGWNATDHGGDGLIIHRACDGTLSFRLWEMKKTSSTGSVSPTVARASQQLRERAPEYLARYQKVGEAQTTGDVRIFFSYLMDHWFDEAHSASVGVSIVAEHQPPPSPCFHQLPAAFPGLCHPSRLRGLLGCISDFKGFCGAVQREVWIAL